MRCTVLVAAAALSALPLRSNEQSVLDATAVLSQTRQALGGDAALNAVTSIDVKGTLTRTLASRSFEQSVEYAAMLPDRFVEVTETTSDLGPLGSAFHQRRSGFAGDEPIDQDETDSPIPPPTIVTKAPTSARRDRRQTGEGSGLAQADVRNVRPAALCHIPRSASGHVLDGRPHRRSDRSCRRHRCNRARRICAPCLRRRTDASHRGHHVDGQAGRGGFSHVRGSRIFVAWRQQRQLVSPPPVLPANPAENLTEVQWQMLEIADYRAANGLTWPHRLTTTFAGRKYLDVKLGAYRINPKIDSGMFRTSK